MIKDYQVEDIQPISLEEASCLLSEAAGLIKEEESVPVLSARGRILAEDVCARYDQPPFSRSPLDGYALRGEDTAGASRWNPVRLSVIGETDAGDVFPGRVMAGQAVRIMTGAPIPEGADAILRQEDSDFGEETVEIYAEVKTWQNYVCRGEDYRRGDVLLEAGEKIGPLEIGILASAGYDKVTVRRPVRVLLISTGDELVLPGTELLPGKIYDSNRHTLQAQLEAWGMQVTASLHSDDDAHLLAAHLREGLDEADLVITTGGVSVGKKDILHEVYRILGVRRLFWKVAMKPGGAVMAGSLDGKIILSLSGNPFSAYAGLQLLGRPILRKMTQDPFLDFTVQEGVLQEPFKKASPSRRFVRCRIEGGRVWLEGHTGGNGNVSSGRGSNALVDIPAGSPSIHAGDKVKVIFL